MVVFTELEKRGREAGLEGRGNQMFCFGQVIFEKPIRPFRGSVRQVVLSFREVRDLYF